MSYREKGLSTMGQMKQIAGILRNVIDLVLKQKTITSVRQTVTSEEDGGINIVKMALSDGSETEFQIRNGLKGNTGPAGPKGDTGEQGPQGSKGDRGEQGPKGDTGPAGKDGTCNASYDADSKTITLS